MECTITRHVRGDGPLCGCGALIFAPAGNGDPQVIGINETKLIQLLKATSDEFRAWLETVKDE